MSLGLAEEGAVAKISAGILLYRQRDGSIEVLLVHPGGPYWRKKDLGVWSIPKGEVEPDEDLLHRAKQEFSEETGFPATGTFLPLAPRRQVGGKLVHAWAVEGNLDPNAITSNRFSLEWPPHSGRRQEFPEVDRAAWFDIETARLKMNRGQLGFLSELETLLASHDNSALE
jgi:predicted NUDIX family NTP pyrophosphohydrolase